MKIKKIIPHLLALVLIAAIVILSATVLLKGRQKTEPEATFATNEGGDIGQRDTVGDVMEPEIVPYHTSYPKSASPSEDYLYTQSLEGYGDVKLCALHQTTYGYYLIAESDCSFGDLSVERQAIAVFLLDTLGNVNNIIILNSRNPMTFQSSKITENGIVIAGNTSENLYLYTLAYDLSGYTADTYPYAARATLFSMSGGVMLYAESSQNTLYAIGRSTSVAFAPPGSLIAAYDFGNYRLAFINGDDSYIIAKYNQKMQCISEISVKANTLLSVLPFTEDGKQYFIAAETNGLKTSLVRYDMSFSRENAQFSSLGNVDEMSLLQENDGFLLVLTGKNSGVYSVNKSLEYAPKNSDILASVTNLTAFSKTDGGYRFIAETASSIFLLSLNDDGTSKSVNLGNGYGGFFAENGNGSVTACFNAVKDGRSIIKIVGV